MGMATILEHHRTSPDILKETLFWLYKLMKHGILSTEYLQKAPHVLQWIGVLDLLTEGVEYNIQIADVFKSFCFVWTLHQSPPPPELQERIIFCINQGLSQHGSSDDTCQSLGQPLLSRIQSQISSRAITTVDQRDDESQSGDDRSVSPSLEGKTREGKRIILSFGINRCAAAA